MSYSHSRSKRLCFENLESKLLLAADLHASVVDGNLFVVGSKGDDDLLIQAAPDDPNTWIVTPLVGDSINGGQPGQAVTLSGVTGSLRVSLRTGNDKITVQGLPQQGTLPRNLYIRAAGQAGQILVSDLVIGNGLSIRTGAASDNIVVRRTEIAGQVVVRSGAGADSIVLEEVAVGKSLDIHAGGGWYNDSISLTQSVVGQDLSARASRGDNEVIVGTTNVGNSTRVRLGDGADRVQIGHVSVAESVMGPSPVPVDPAISVQTKHLQIQTAGGDDDVDVSRSLVARHLRAYLGDGSDVMTVRDSTIGGNSVVEGEAGDDLLEAGTYYGGELYSAGHHDGTYYFTSPWPYAGQTSFNGGEGEDTLRFDRDPGVNQDDRLWKNWESVFDVQYAITLPLNPAVSPADAVNSSAADLYHKLADSEENFVFSPLSISAALAMVYAGAEANTAAEMAEVLHFPENSDEFHAQYGELLESLNQADALEGLDLNVANSLWGQVGFPFNQDYLDLILASYNGGLQDVDFVNQTEAARETINQWVEQETRDKIQDLIPQGVLTLETVLVLANAVYFDAKWAHEFDVYATQPDSFYVSADEEMLVDMMHDTANYNYMERDGVQYVELPYRDGRFSMLLALPGDGTPLSQVDVTAMTNDLSEFLSGLELQRVAVSLPKFEATSMPDVKQALIDLGINDLFDRDLSDLDGMKDPQYVLDGNLFVQDIRHKAFIELDEAGTTAAAATAVIVGVATSMPPQPVYFTADHPFQYYICDTQTDTILFMGHVSRPTEAEPLQLTK